MINEIKVMRRLKGHRYIIQLYEVYETGSNVYLVMELLKGGNLQTRIQKKKKLSVDESISVMRSLCDGIYFMHQRNIMHRDLKLANILLVDEETSAVKLVDFGLATDADECPYLYHRCGTPGYVAPEILNSKEGNRYEVICDVFSLGVIFFILYSAAFHLIMDT
jgi:serine/threonine protein kinase